MKNLFQCFCLLSLFLLPEHINGQSVFPLKQPFGVDHTGTALSQKDIEDLFQRSAWLRDSADVNVKIEVIATTFKKPIKQFARDRANRAFLYEESYGNNLYILVVKNDRKVRIEVSRKLNKILTDEKTKEIIDRYMTIQFALGNYKKGLENGLDQISAVLSHHQKHPLERYAKYLFLGFGLLWFIIIEILKRLAINRWVVKLIGFAGYLLIAMTVVEAGVAVGFALIMFLISFMAFKFPRKRFAIRKLKNVQNNDMNIVSIGILGIALIRDHPSNQTIGSSRSGGYFDGGGSYSGGDSGGFSGGGGFDGGGADGGW